MLSSNSSILPLPAALAEHPAVGRVAVHHEFTDQVLVLKPHLPVYSMVELDVEHAAQRGNCSIILVRGDLRVEGSIRRLAPKGATLIVAGSTHCKHLVVVGGIVHVDGDLHVSETLLLQDGATLVVNGEIRASQIFVDDAAFLPLGSVHGAVQWFPSVRAVAQKSLDHQGARSDLQPA